MYAAESLVRQQHQRETDLVFESHFTNGSQCVLAREEAPKIRFNKSMPLELVQVSIDKWNRAIQDSFPGVGHFAFSPMDEMVSPEQHVLVLFADEDFFNAFMGSVVDITLTAPAGMDDFLSESSIIEEISLDDVKLPWDY